MKRKAYLTSEQLIEEYRNCKKLGKLTSKMAEYFMMIAERYSRHPWFVGYSYREDLVAAGVLALVNTWHKFDPDKPYFTKDGKPRTHNAFAFYTQCCYYAFRDYLRDEKRESDIKNKLLIEHGYDPSFMFDEPETV